MCVVHSIVLAVPLTLLFFFCHPIGASLIKPYSLGESEENTGLGNSEINGNIPYTNHGNGNNPIESVAELAFELTQALNLQRQERVQRECELAAATDQHNSDGNRSVSSNDYEQQIASIPDDQLEHLLIDEKHKFLYCYVPKVSKLYRYEYTYSDYAIYKVIYVQIIFQALSID